MDTGAESLEVLTDHEHNIRATRMILIKSPQKYENAFRRMSAKKYK